MKKLGYLALSGLLMFVTACGPAQVIYEINDVNNQTAVKDLVDENTVGSEDINIEDEIEITEGAPTTEYPGISEENLETMKRKMADYKSVLDNDSEIDDLYVSFLLGERFLPVESVGTTFVYSSYSINDELFDCFFESDAYYALIDVNGDGTKELYYKIVNTDNMVSYSFVVGITDEGTLKIFDCASSYNLRHAFYINANGYWIEESTLDQTDSYYVVYKFDKDGNKYILEEVYSYEYDHYEDYMNAAYDMAVKYGTDESLDLITLSEAIMG